LTFVPKKENYVWVTKRNNGHNPYYFGIYIFDIGPFQKTKKRVDFGFYIFYDMQENLQAFIYKKISKIPVETQKIT